MNEVINLYYKIDVVGIIKITNKVFKIKSKDNKCYCLKFCDENIENIFSNLLLLHINSFILPYMNINNNYITNYENNYFYLVDWYNDEPISIKELKMKFFIDEIINLHNLSMYNLKINKGYIEDVFLELEKLIIQEENDLEFYLKNIEKKEYKSPSEWLFIMNNQLFKESLQNANKYLNIFKDEISKIKEIRFCLNYLNFDFKNIIIKERKIIGIEKIKKSSLVNDLYNIYENSFKQSIDISIYFKKYFDKIKINEYEKYWLLTLINIPQIEYNNDDEIKKIIDITTLIYKINVGKDIEKILTENN